jgi:hypothetical protein
MESVNGTAAVVYTQFIVKPSLFAASCLLLAGLVARSDLKGSPFYAQSDIFITDVAGHELYPRVVLGLPDTFDFYWPESTPTNILSDSEGRLQDAIFFTLLAGGVLRYLMSETVRRFFQDVLNPLNWNLYE